MQKLLSLLDIKTEFIFSPNFNILYLDYLRGMNTNKLVAGAYNVLLREALLQKPLTDNTQKVEDNKDKENTENETLDVNPLGFYFLNTDQYPSSRKSSLNIANDLSYQTFFIGVEESIHPQVSFRNLANFIKVLEEQFSAFQINTDSLAVLGVVKLGEKYYNFRGNAYLGRLLVTYKPAEDIAVVSDFERVYTALAR